MTPLAQKIMRELTLPAKRRSFVDRADLLSSMKGLRFFECTAALGAYFELANSGDTLRAVPERLLFLPAPRTWIEFSLHDYGRFAYVLEAAPPGYRGFVVTTVSGAHFSAASRGLVPLGSMPELFAAAEIDKQFDISLFAVYTLLAFINSPGLAEWREHPPHAGLRRDLERLSRSEGVVYDLRPWTEIKIEVGAPIVVDEQSGGLRLGGRKAEHEVRAHPRVIGGKWVLIDGVRRRVGGREIIVKAHKRGDPALGIVQSRYRVVPPRNGAPA